MSDPQFIEDERIAFYYRHRDDIRRWAAIEKEIPPHVHRYLLSLKPRVASLAGEFQAYPYSKDLDRGHPKLLLVRRPWLRSSEQARVGIGIEWRSNRVNLFSEKPYVGVWVDKTLDDGEALYASLSDALTTARGNLGYKSSGWWPAWKHVGPDKGDAFWEDLSPLSDKLMDHVRQSWRAFADTVDDVVARNPR